MAEKTKSLSRRAMLGGVVVGGGAIAAAAAKTGLTSGVTETFASSFSSTNVSLERADHTVWMAEVGKTLTVENGPTLRIASVETFVGYGATQGLIRSRAFLVNLQATTTGRIVGNTLYRMTHKRYGTFNLYLVTSPLSPTFAQAVFN